MTAYGRTEKNSACFPQEVSFDLRAIFSHYKASLLACAFFTVATLRLPMLYVSFFIEVGTSRIQAANVIAYPTQA